MAKSISQNVEKSIFSHLCFEDSVAQFLKGKLKSSQYKNSTLFLDYFPRTCAQFLLFRTKYLTHFQSQRGWDNHSYNEHKQSTNFLQYFDDFFRTPTTIVLSGTKVLKLSSQSTGQFHWLQTPTKSWKHSLSPKISGQKSTHPWWAVRIRRLNFMLSVSTFLKRLLPALLSKRSSCSSTAPCFRL